MPELPEVETTRRGIEPHILNRQVTDLVVRESRLRWPVPAKLYEALTGKTIRHVGRRGKYLLLDTGSNCLIMHLGMSGSLRVVDLDLPPEKHDHIDIVMDNDQVLRFRDPRRFGAVLLTDNDPLQHERLVALGPEPLDKEFDGDYLFRKSRNKKQNVKAFIMDSHVVVGVGNIYASESLFMAGIRPDRIAGSISRKRYARLAEAIKTVLIKAIDAGGTSLRDFVQSDGKPGYFKIELQVYGKTGEPCPVCNKPVRQVELNKRSTFFCSACQT